MRPVFNPYPFVVDAVVWAAPTVVLAGASVVTSSESWFGIVCRVLLGLAALWVLSSAVCGLLAGRRAAYSIYRGRVTRVALRDVARFEVARRKAVGTTGSPSGVSGWVFVVRAVRSGADPVSLWGSVRGAEPELDYHREALERTVRRLNRLRDAAAERANT